MKMVKMLCASVVLASMSFSASAAKYCLGTVSNVSVNSNGATISAFYNSSLDPLFVPSSQSNYASIVSAAISAATSQDTVRFYVYSETDDEGRDVSCYDNTTDLVSNIIVD
ncbi:hypothetical protein [Bowmanella denitrificans]|uniref:hypothetical protein n=1 Tax=Bowmanella denitrificans TaxID=366582 RepID=UPI0011AF4237|nr:hypothetical protein [Bowmanella denitrificans]